VNGHGQSDRSVVPANPPNKAAAAEAGEERGRAKGNAASETRPGRRGGPGVSSELDRVRQVAQRDNEARLFAALLHHVSLHRLWLAFDEVNPKASPGVDGVNWAEYERDLGANLRGPARAGAVRALPGVAEARNHRHQVLVRGPARRRRQAGPEVVMSRRARQVTLLLAGTVLAAGCGSAARQSGAPASPAQQPSLSTSLVTTTGTRAVAVLGGPAAQHNNFWQLFVRPPATGRWRLATPPGVASNGGLVVAGLGAGSVVAGFRPSQDPSYSPLATTHDNGTAWTPGLLDAALADVPDALAAAPGGGHLLALLASGDAELSSPGGTAWTRLATRRALAASAAGGRCGLGSLTAAAFSSSGFPCRGRQLCPPRDGRRLRVCGRDVAPGRAHPAGFVRAPACHRAPAHRHGRHHHGTADSGHRGCGTPARRLVHRQRCPLGPVAGRCHCTARKSPRHRPGPAAPWRWR